MAPRVEPCSVCGRRHQKPETAAKCATRAASAAAPLAVITSPAPAADVVVEPSDIIDALHLLDGRLIRFKGRTGSASVIAVSPSLTGSKPLPGQIAHQYEIARLLVEISGADPAEVARAFNGTIRAGKSLASIIPVELLDLAAAELTLRARELDALTARTTLRSAA